MTHLKSYKTFDIVIVPFPFVDSDETKIRPAIVISSEDFNAAHNTVLMMITSASHSSWPHDTEIVDLQAAGLSKKSIIRCKLFTIDNRLIKKVIGRLASLDQVALTEHFCALFGAMLKSSCS